MTYSYTCTAPGCRITVEGLGYPRRHCHRCGGPVEPVEPASLLVAVNVQAKRCASCGGVHPFISRECQPIAWPAGYTPLGLPTQPARPPARVWPDVEAAALRYKVAVSAN